MKFLLIALACLTVASASMLGQKKCTWGPSYWCQHIGTAKECGAVSHCITVWKNNRQPPVTSTESCLICKGLIKDLKAIVASKSSQSEIKDLALKACALLHNEKTAQEVCDTVVVMFLPEILKMIESDLDGSKICNAVGLCSTKIEAKFKLAPVVKHVVKNLKSQECDECKLGVTFVKSFLSENSTQQEIIKYLTQEICPHLPGELGTLCQTAIADNLPKVFAELEQILNPDSVCSMIGMCPKKIGAKNLIRQLIVKLAPRKYKSNPIECDLCEAGITDIRVALREKTTQTDVINFLKSHVCPHLGSLSVTCTQVVDQYIPVAFQLLVSELDPSTICGDLGLCTKTVKVTKVKPVTPMKYPKAGPLCVLCEFVMREVDQLIGSNRSVAAVEYALDKVCSILPSTIRSECDGFVHQYTPLLVKLIVQDVSPSLICRTIGLCAGEKEPQIMNHRQMFETCDLMMRYLRVLIKGTRLPMEHAHNIVCNFLPRKDRMTCRKVKAKFSAKLHKLGKAGITHQSFKPRDFCKSHRVLPKPNGLVHLLGRTKCTQGPSFWCANYSNAAMCGAINHCMEHYWKTKGLL